MQNSLSAYLMAQKKLDKKGQELYNEGVELMEQVKSDIIAVFKKYDCDFNISIGQNANQKLVIEIESDKEIKEKDFKIVEEYMKNVIDIGEGLTILLHQTCLFKWERHADLYYYLVRIHQLRTHKQAEPFEKIRLFKSDCELLLELAKNPEKMLLPEDLLFGRSEEKCWQDTAIVFEKILKAFDFEQSELYCCINYC